MWAAFAAAMTLVVGLLALNDERRPGGFWATNLSAMPVGPAVQSSDVDPVFQIEADLDRQRWQGIVIHHLGAPAGDAESLHRQHQSFGWDGLGYHFLIGNGNGLDDGVVHVGYRWNRQLPGVHATGQYADELNRRTIGICLIGNGDRRPFTDRQLRHLTVLVRRLQRELGIGADAVWLHRDVAAGQTGPGRYFPAAEFAGSLLTR